MNEIVDYFPRLSALLHSFGALVSPCPQSRQQETETTADQGSSITSPRKESGVSRTNKEVVIQAFLFIVAFLGTFLFVYINRMTKQIHGSSPFWLQLLARTVISLQGEV